MTIVVGWAPRPAAGPPAGLAGIRNKSGARGPRAAQGGRPT